MDLKHIQSIFPSMGKIEFISVRPQRLQPVIPVQSVQVVKDHGLKGDHYSNMGGSRQVTFFQAEHLDVLRSLLNANIDPGQTRRNIMIRGLNLLALKGKLFQIGDAIFEYSGECHPCSRMESEIAVGAYNAMRGHGGITAKVIQSGVIGMGDSVCVVHTNAKA
jgi:MOSC domain-containing protein YiiM